MNKIFAIVIFIASIFGCTMVHAKSLEEIVSGAVVVNPRAESVIMTTQFSLPLRAGAWSVFGMQSRPVTIQAKIEGGDCLVSPFVQVSMNGRRYQIEGTSFELTVMPNAEIQIGLYGAWGAGCITEFQTKIVHVKSEAEVINFPEPGATVRLSN